MIARELFRNKHLAIEQKNEYTYVHELMSNGSKVAILPFHSNLVSGQPTFLARLEVCPAHSSEAELCSITGGVEDGETIVEAAIRELWEEAGFHTEEKNLIKLGRVRQSKISDTIVHIFAVDVTSKKQSDPPGDGSFFEANATVQWVNFDQGIQVEDPLFVTAIMRLLNSQ